MSEAFNPLATPNAQQWLKKGVDEKEKAVFGVDYTSLLAQSGEDKARAFDMLADNLKDADFNFDIMKFSYNNDKAAAFDALKEQNTYFAALPQENENERAKRERANQKVREDIAILSDENASSDDKNTAQMDYYDYLLKFGGGDKEQKKEFKNNVVRPFLEQQKSALASEMSDTNAEKIELIDKKLNDLRDKDKKLYEIDENKLEMSDLEIAQKFGLAGESSLADKGKRVIDTIFNFFDPYLDSTIMNADKIKNAEQAKVAANARTKIEEALIQGKEPKRSDFTLQEQYQFYLSGYASSDLGEKYADVANIAKKDQKIVDDFIQKGIENYKKELEIANTDYDKLTSEQRQWLYDKAGVFNRGWDRIFKDDDEESIEQAYNVVKGGALMKIASERAQSVQNFAKTHNLAWLGANYVIGSDENFDKEYQNYLDNVEGIALDMKFDGIDKSGQYFYKFNENGEPVWFKLNDGFFDNVTNIFADNTYSIIGGLGGVAGGIYMAKKGKLANAGRGIIGGLGETGGAVVGSFLGSSAGGAADYINYALSNGVDFDFSQMMTHATQEGLFSLVADGVAVGLSKLAQTKSAKALFAPVAKAAQGVDTLVRKSPILGTIYSMPRNFFKGQNIEAAEELVLRYYTPEQRADIENALKELGGGLNIGASGGILGKNSQIVADKLAQKYGSESSIAKTAQGFADAINMKGFKERQAKLLQFVISDESGKNLGYVLEIAGKSPEVAKNLEILVKYSGLQLENAIKNLNLPENQFKAVFKEFEKGTAESFDEAMKLIGEQIFDPSVYKTKIDKAPFDDFLKAMSDEKIYMGDAEKRFLKEIIEPLFDESGVSFSQLNNIRKQLNSKFKDIQSPTFKDYLQGQVGKKLREAVDKGINDIFRQNPRAYAKVKELYDTALKEYSTMKDIQTIIKKHNFNKEETNFAKDFNKLLKFIIEGKGDEKTPNLERLLGQLTAQNRAVAEVNILKQLLDSTKISLKQQFGRGQTRTFFTWDFIDKLDELTKRGNVFQSKEAQDFIKIVKDWHKLNKNHADILYSLKPADVKEVRQGIATRIEGRLEQMRTNLLMSNIFRLLDKIPFANALWDKTQAGALRFHIKNALSNSISIDDFKFKLLNRVEKGNFDNKTKQLIREIIGEADNAEQSLAKIDEMENEILSLSDEELLKRTQNAEKAANITPASNANANKVQSTKAPANEVQKTLLDEINTQKAVLASKQKSLENLNKQAEMTYLDPYAFRVEKAQLELDIAQRQQKINELENEILKKNDLPTKTTLEKPLQPAEIKQSIDKWDLDNPSPSDKILISKVQGDELEQLKKEFDFKGNYALAREIEAKNVKHALTQHGDEAKEATRGQIAITKDDIANYQQFTQEPDLRIVQDNNRIIYAKQINGHYVVIEEVLTGQNKLQFFDMWKGKGKINKEVLLSHSQRPKHDFEPNFNRHMPSNTDEIIPNSSVQSQAAQSTQTKSKFELDEWNGKVDKTNRADFIDDAVGAIERRELFETPIFDPTKKAVANKNEALQRLDELESTNAYPKEAIDSVRDKLIKDDENLSQSTRAFNEQRRVESEQIEADKAKIKAQQKAEYPNGIYHYETPSESVSIRLSDDGAEVTTHNKDFDSKGKMTTQREHAVNLIKVGENTKNAIFMQRPQEVQNTTPKSQGENQILAENVINYIKNANKEQLEYELKSIEANNAYNKKALDYYKQRLPENPYFQSEIDFVENQLLKDTEKQKLITQRLDELKRGENANKAFEFSTPKEPKSAFAMRKELREVLEPVFDKPLTNANDGRVAVISKKKSSKLSSSKAAEKSVENGFSEAQHFETAKHLPELYENAKFKDTMPDKNGYDNLQIHHYTADFVLDGEPAQAKITLKEIIDGQHAGNRIYTIELESVAKLPAEPQTLTKQNAMSRKPTSSAVDTPTANPNEIIPNTAPKSQATPLQESSKNQQILDEYLAQNEKLAQGMKEIVGKDDISVDDFIDILNGSNAELKFTKEDLLDYDKLVKAVPYTTLELAKILGLYKKELEKGIDAVRENLRQMFQNGRLKENDKGKYLFTDKDGKRHILDKDLAHKWLHTFDLKSFDDDFVPQIKDEFKPFLQNGEIHLKIGSLIKINERNRGEFIKHIKPTLQEPDFILKDQNGVLFVKDIGDDKVIFTSIIKNQQGEWVVSSNSYKRIKTLKNRIGVGNTEILYQSKKASNILVEAFTDTPFRAKLNDDLPELPIIAQPELTAKALNGEAKSKNILPQTQGQSQATNAQQTREFYSQINALRKEKDESIAQAKNEFATTDKEITPAKYKYNLLNTIKSEVKQIDDELGFDHNAYSTITEELRRGKNGIAKMAKVKRKAFSFKDLQHARESINLMKENLTNDEFKEAREYFQRVIDKVEPLLKNNDSIDKAKANLAEDLDTKIRAIEKEYDDKITRLRENFANTPKGIEDKRVRTLLTNLKIRAKEYSYIDKEAFAKEHKAYKETMDEEMLARHLRHLSTKRNNIEQATNATPLKEFGTNYAEFYKDGVGAVKKLLAEAKAASEAGENFNGQVAGAFWCKELGDIDLVFGDESMGLAHIVKKHGDEFTQFKGDTQAEKIANALSEIVENGKIIDDKDIKTILFKKDNEIYRVGLSKGFKGNGNNLWIITSYKVDKSPRSDFLPSSEVIKGDGTNLHPSDLTNEIIPKIQNKFKQSEQWAKNLFEWHKDSSPLTKEADGTPKVFYHGTQNDFNVFENDYTGWGFWFGNDKNKVKIMYQRGGKLLECFLKIKKPFDLYEPKNTALLKDLLGKKKFDEKYKSAIRYYESLGLKEKVVPLDILSDTKFLNKEQDALIFKNFLKNQGYDGINYGEYGIVVFDSNQIKSVGNKGTFDSTNPNILMSNQHLGAGLLGGSINGIETDENGNVVGFSPEKFVAGFLGGAGASKATQFALKNPKFRAKADKFLKESGEFIVRELKNSDLPQYARNVLENALGKNLVKMLDSRLWIVEPQQAVTTLKRRTKNIIAQEQLALKGVVYDGDKAALIYKDLEQIDEAILLQKGNKNKGGKHIRLEHTQDEAQLGFVTPDEVANIGQNVRKYL